MVMELIAVVGSIRGAVWGAKVGADATRAATQQAIDAEREAAHERERQQRSAVRLLLSLEVDHNLARLRTVWEDVTGDEPRHYSDDRERQRRATGRDRANASLRLPMPVWTRKAWEGLVPLLPLALSRAKIEQVNTVYGQLDTISAIRAQLAEMAAERPYQEVWDSPIEGRPLYHTVHPQTFNDNAPDLWGRIEEIVDHLLTDGNPISEHEDGATEPPRVR